MASGPPRLSRRVALSLQLSATPPPARGEHALAPVGAAVTPEEAGALVTTPSSWICSSARLSAASMARRCVVGVSRVQVVPQNALPWRAAQPRQRGQDSLFGLATAHDEEHDHDDCDRDANVQQPWSPVFRGRGVVATAAVGGGSTGGVGSTAGGVGASAI